MLMKLDNDSIRIFLHREMYIKIYFLHTSSDSEDSYSFLTTFHEHMRSLDRSDIARIWYFIESYCVAFLGSLDGENSNKLLMKCTKIHNMISQTVFLQLAGKRITCKAG